MNGVRTPGLVTIGETLGLLSSPTPGPFVHQRALELSIGGAESNVAVGVCRLGLPATWISALGDDPFGALIRRELAAEGVRVIARENNCLATGLMVKNRRSADRTDVLYYRTNSAAAALQVDDVPDHVIEEAQLIHLSGITPALSQSCGEVVRHVAAIAARCDIPLSVDVNYRRRLWSPQDAVAALTPIIEQAHLVFASLDEAHLFTDAGDADRTARELAARSAGVAVIKLGDQGAMAYADGSAVHGPAVPITPIDTVGAGDAFVAGYLSEFMRGASVEDSLALGNLCGAAACAVVSDWQGALTAGDVADWRTPSTDAVDR